MIRIHSKTKKKLLVLLAAGAVIGLGRSRTKTGYILKRIPKALRDIDKDHLYRLVKQFNNDRLVNYKEDRNGEIKIILTEDGEKQALTYSLDNLTINKPLSWNGKWHLVLFDIPEKKRQGRDVLREKLKELGFYEWQKSAFIYPYPCEKEINFIIEVFDLRPYVRYAELNHPTNEAELKIKFKLT